ncbi:MAG: CDP-alcohol phosphatidyltransferase family protein [Cryomorphaceae bacterium]|nr:CDP-alcohol phosphatidyltransferase family protein [Cryomorphaceae bacterium]
MQRIIQAIPHALTLANLLFGILGIFHAFDRNWNGVLMMLAAALLMDVFDGMAARKLNVSGELGKQLDSLADMVSFGVLPGITLFWLMRDQCEPLSLVQNFLPLLAFSIPLCTALRLAKFNIDTRQGNYFIGLPSPSQAIAVIGLTAWAPTIEKARNFGINPAAIYLLFALIFCWAMLSEKLKLPAFKSLSLPGAKAVMIIVFATALILFFFFEWKSLSAAILLYLLLGVVIFKPQSAVKNL